MKIPPSDQPTNRIAVDAAAVFALLFVTIASTDVHLVGEEVSLLSAVAASVGGTLVYLLFIRRFFPRAER